MAESSTHMQYVSILFEFVKHIVPQNNSSLILIDTPNSLEVPNSVIDGFRPDLSYKMGHFLIIGEAKTDDDVERRHSLNQYYSYLKEAEEFDGDSIVVFCVSWKMFSTLKNHLRALKKMHSFNRTKVIVLNNKGDVCSL